MKFNKLILNYVPNWQTTKRNETSREATWTWTTSKATMPLNFDAKDFQRLRINAVWGTRVRIESICHGDGRKWELGIRGFFGSLPQKYTIKIAPLAPHSHQQFSTRFCGWVFTRYRFVFTFFFVPSHPFNGVLFRVLWSLCRSLGHLVI